MQGGLRATSVVDVDQKEHVSLVPRRRIQDKSRVECILVQGMGNEKKNGRVGANNSQRHVRRKDEPKGA